MENSETVKSLWEHMLAIIEPVSKINAGSLEKHQTAWHGTE
jgi:hypothetical protein